MCLIRFTPIIVLHHMTNELPGKFRYELATAKEIAKAFTFDLPLAKSLAGTDILFYHKCVPHLS